MTQYDETMSSPPSPSPEHMQLHKISSQVDTTISEFSTIQQHVHDMIAHICGLKWYQHSCHTKLSYPQWKQLQKQTSQLTYQCAGIDEALMRHLFSLDAITGDDCIRTIRRSCVHRIKQTITHVEQYTSYMYRIQYWIKKWIKHEEEETLMETETTSTTTEPMSPLKHEETTPTSPSIKPSTTPMSPPTKSSTLHPPHTKPRSNSTSLSHHTPIKSRSISTTSSHPTRSLSSSPAFKNKTLLSTPKASPTLKSKSLQSPSLSSKSLQSKSPTLSSKSFLSKSPFLSPLPKSTPASPVLPTRHIAPQQPPSSRTPSSPRFHVSHDSTHITINALLPGVSRDSLDVTIRGHILRITGLLMGESFVREMELPETCDVDQLDAAWEEETDTLKIRVPIVKKMKSPQSGRRSLPSRPTSRYGPDQDQEMDEEDDHDQPQHYSHPYYSRPMNYSSRCAPSYMHPSYPSYSRHPLYAAPPRHMFGSPFGGFW